MKTKILLAVDGSESSKRAAKYVGSLLGSQPDVSVTLFHVLVPIPPALLETGSPKSADLLEDKRESWTEAEKHLESKVLVPIRKILKDGPFRDEQLHAKCVAPLPESDIAHEILNECQESDYDTIVLGKRGTSRIHFFLTGGITEKVLRHAKNRAVWVIE